jgi:hypothetical protein
MLVRNSSAIAAFACSRILGTKSVTSTMPITRIDRGRARRPDGPTDYSEKIQRPAIFVGDWRPVYGSTTESKWPLATPTLRISSRYSEDRITELAASAEGCRNGRGPYCGNPTI